MHFFVKLNFIRLRNFRNIAFADVELGGESAWICGKNAQGKTNLLEAAGMLNALRSFRTGAMESLIRAGESSAEIFAGAESPKHGSCEISIEIGAEKRVAIDGEKIAKLADFIGKFPTVAITNEDIKLVRGAPEARRKDIDMFASSLDAQYFENLRRYHRAMAHRNALLRVPRLDEPSCAAFEAEMAGAAEYIIEARAQTLGELGKTASAKYAALAKSAPESAEITLKQSCDAREAAEFAEMLRKNRLSDAERKSTQKGVHRDDFKIFIDGKDAKLYASEGQQKSAAIALRLAQIELAKQRLGETPLVLCDDILGELDEDRKAGFWSAIGDIPQIIATSTEPPNSGNQRRWKIFRAENGSFNERG